MAEFRLVNLRRQALRLGRDSMDMHCLVDGESLPVMKTEVLHRRIEKRLGKSGRK